MNSEGENKLKIRFRLPNGEEFEAEGPQPFIEQQRDYFLTLIGAQTGADFAIFPNTNRANMPATGGTDAPAVKRGVNAPTTVGNMPAAKRGVLYNIAPHQVPHIAPPPAAPYTEHPGAARLAAAPQAPFPDTPNTRAATNKRPENSAEILFWERIFKQENGLLVLRYKAKLAPQELAVLLLAGARVLLGKDTYSALELAKSFKASGGPEGRLDRFLTGELQSGRIVAQGAKRSRTYHLSDEGFARAFVLAKKLQK